MLFLTFIFIMCEYLQTGASPLYIACQNGHIQVCKYLLAKFADSNLALKVILSHIYLIHFIDG